MTSYCLEGNRGDSTCEPMPVACQCAETRGCDCLVATVTRPCDAAGAVACSATLFDGGLLFLDDPFCP
jgi:hypothetical protein